MKRNRVEYTLWSEKIAEPLRFAVVADLHDAPFEDLLPDFQQTDGILVVGDLVSRYRDTYREAARFLQLAPETAPVFYSVGNHERRCSYREEWRKLVAGSAVRLLDDEWTVFRGICLGGLSSRPYGQANGDFLEKYAREPGFRLLMCHHPEVYRDHVAGRGIDFTVCGHAHGGQIQLFGRGLIAPGQGFFPKMTHGLYDENRMLLSRGLTNSTRIPRINNPLELILLNLRPGTETKIIREDRKS